MKKLIAALIASMFAVGAFAAEAASAPAADAAASISKNLRSRSDLLCANLLHIFA
jgi:hypothetical protein